MDISALLIEAGNLMLTGMVVVFVFLSILIITIKAMSKVLVNFQPSSLANKKSQPSSHNSAIPQAHIAAISAAIKQYRNK